MLDRCKLCLTCTKPKIIAAGTVIARPRLLKLTRIVSSFPSGSIMQTET